MRVVPTLVGQFDAVRIYTTGCTCDYKWCDQWPHVEVVKGNDVGSAAKFHFYKPDANEYYFTCDDDILYPPDYAEKTIEQYNGGYVSYHGRRLVGLGRKYYSGHKLFHCMGGHNKTEKVDVPGTGVGMFHTSKFNPRKVARTEWRNMDDVAIGYLCAEQGVSVLRLPTQQNWLKNVPLRQRSGIFQQEYSRCHRQNKLADKIYMMTREQPKVSVIIPYSVDRGWLNEAIESVEHQSYLGEIELILSHSKANVSTNLNNGIKKATGKHITYLCEDDLLPMDALAYQVAAMRDNDLIHGAAFILRGDKYESWKSPNKTPTVQSLVVNNTINGGTVMYRRDLFDRVGYFDESLNTAEEYEFNMRCLSKGMKIGYTPEKVYTYRRHDRQKSLGKGVDQAWRNEVKQQVKNRYI